MFNRKTRPKIPPLSFVPRGPEGRRLYAVGDIHGREDLIVRLLDLIEQDAGGRSHQIVFLGDYIDRGFGTKQVLESLVALKKRAPETVFLLGNHEQVMLDFIADPEEKMAWLEWGGASTLKSYGLTDIEHYPPVQLRDQLLEAMPDSHFNFLMDLTNLYRIGHYLFVHAGLKPGVRWQDQVEEDILWIRDEFYNAAPDQWGELVVVHGHTPEPEAQDTGWRINVDTGAVWTGQLTALVIDGAQRRYLKT